MSVAYEFKTPYIEELKNKLTVDELDKWLDFFKIRRSKDSELEYNKYWYDIENIDTLGQQAVVAFQNLKKGK